MVHLLASVAFTMVALGMFALIAFMLLAEQDKIMTALGLDREAARPIVRRPVRIRKAGRWQAEPACAVSPQRAVA
jgi:hypothetical protein